MSTPMSPNAPAGPDDFREQLSAWHDGALTAEASRFVARRLLQDETLRAEVARWQVIGDVLRRHPLHRPSETLAGRVAARIVALPAEVPEVSEASSRRGSPPGRGIRWMATAAAAALAAVLIWPSAPAPVDDAPASLVAGGAGAAAPQPPRRAGFDHPAPMPLRRQPVADVDALAHAVPPLVRAPQPTPEQLAPLPAVDAPGRPWPRSVAGEGGYAVDYRAPAAEPPRQ